MSDLIGLPESVQESSYFWEGAILAANLTVKPLEPELWASELCGEEFEAVKPTIIEHINAQYGKLKANQYSVLELTNNDSEHLADLAEGFLAIWPIVEQEWQSTEVADGTARMLSALLTTLSLLVDEEQTHQQMKEAGYEELPQINDLQPQLDLMVNEVAQAADELMVGNKSQTLNPFKDVGRNDSCPCGSGKKFKKCCGS
ncbi:SEC-C metal-binding domain-containing protein [Vibrio breoganii]|uniref:YecA family protein n=1 Tax=Vibrio breoganii TaxID=553239 RepID=UPI000C81CE09|nr:SEC-C metal-binding domain-containing protein [Vibrio breoganii]PMF67167.1 prepilin peptidase [Vibrio breoganii]PMH15883.1 prepilin peptidase [Vibrio breoganii]PMK52755.1 prepilin peptidase [Vibrio breoganii]PMK71934.1 prepilin peptidase [Vibrio breoganii]PMM13053.1 prepilin peptidase [Vibrio breoganii]